MKRVVKYLMPALLLFSIPNFRVSQEADSAFRYGDLQYISNTYAEKVAILVGEWSALISDENSLICVILFKTQVAPNKF